MPDFGTGVFNITGNSARLLPGPHRTGEFKLYGNSARLKLGPHVEQPAYYTCATGGKPVGFDINCSLICYLGRPFISGMLTVETYMSSCEDALPIPTYGYNPNAFFVSVGCSPAYNDRTLLNNTWVGTATAETSHFTPGYGYRVRFDVILTAAEGGGLSAVVTTLRLMPGNPPYWATCNTATFTLTMTADNYRTREYTSVIIPVSFDEANCTSEVKFMKARLVLDAYLFGCAVADVANAQKCALYSMRGGLLRSYSCLMCLVTPAVRHAWNPQMIQLGYNPVGCGMGSRCGCWEWDGFVLTPLDSDPMDLRSVGCPDETPTSNIQQIQYGRGGKNSTGHSYEIILKTINRTGDICVAARVSGSPWVIGAFGVIQEVNPFIGIASFTGLVADDPVFYFYGMEFPTATVLSCDELLGHRGVPDMPALMDTNGTSNEMTTTTGVTPPPPPMPAEVKKIVSVIQNPCIHLGNALEDVPSCGCGGKSAVKHECKLYGTCRVYSRDKTIQNCVDCPSYKAKEST